MSRGIIEPGQNSGRGGRTEVTAVNGVQMFVRRFGDLPLTALQPDLLADDVAVLIRHYGAAQADVLVFSYGGVSGPF